jgi:hypothetical protein
MPPAEAGDAGAAPGGRVPAAWPRPVHAGNENYPGGFRRAGGRRAASGSRARRYAAKAAGRACGLRRYPAMAPGALAGAPRNPPRQRRGSRPVPTSRARPRVPTSRRRARRPCPGDGHQVQPGTSMRSSASDDPHRSVVGRSGRLGAQSHLICMPQDADRHDAAIGADRRFSRTGLQQNQSLYVTTDWADVLRADSGLVADGILGGFGMCRTAVPQGVGEAGSGISAATAGNQRGPRRQWVLFLVASAGWGVGGSAGRRSSAGPACGSCGVGHAGPAPL